jgi:hypothetical protein
VAPESPTTEPTTEPSESPSEDPSGDPSGSPATPTPTPAPTASPAETATTIVRDYFVLGSLTGNPGLVPVLREVPETRAVLATALRELFKGPKGAELEGSPAMYSAIPEGTRLLDVTIDNGIATIVVSDQFDEASKQFEQAAALSQLVYTATQFSNVRAAEVHVGDADAPSSGTLHRSDFQEIGVLPAIFVDRPAWGAAAGNPARISGIAHVFEATFQVELLDGRGNQLAHETVNATCGTGCWGTFKTDLPYEINKAQYGTLRVYADSAKDGSPESVTEYRVWLTP